MLGLSATLIEAVFVYLCICICVVVFVYLHVTHEYTLNFTEPISCHATLSPTVQLKGQIQIWQQEK